MEGLDNWGVLGEIPWAAHCLCICKKNQRLNKLNGEEMNVWLEKKKKCPENQHAWFIQIQRNLLGLHSYPHSLYIKL